MRVTPRTSGRSRAFLLGNGAYTHLCRLKKTGNDVRELKASLQRLGFSVTDYCDLTSAKLEEQFSKFLDGLTEHDTALLYYSGHGIQINGVNYVVPPEFDFKSPGFLKSLVSIQSLIDRLTACAATTLVFLDACRNNPLPKQLSAKLEHDARRKGLERPEMVVTGPGLAAFTEKGQAGFTPMFIAYAAAPGSVAYESTDELSIFTKGLVSTIETDDLPILNLMLRVADYVKETSEGKQEPWSASSLSSPFYFRKSSLVWFNANLIGFVALAVMMVIHSIIVWDAGARARLLGGFNDAPDLSVARMIILSSVFLVVSFLLCLLGIVRTYRFARGEFKQDEEGRWGRSFVGGFFGGIFAAPLLAVPYSWTWRGGSLGVLLCENMVAAIATGLVLGPLSYVMAVTAHKRAKTAMRRVGWSVAGGVAGGLIAGILIGPLATLYFGGLWRPLVQPEILLFGCLFGTIVLVFSIITYDIDRFSYRNMRAKAKAAVSGSFIAGVIAFAIVVTFRSYIESVAFRKESLLLIGVPIGMTVGAILGLAIGIAVAIANKDKPFGHHQGVKP
jgi:caspase domain-containing protein